MLSDLHPSLEFTSNPTTVLGHGLVDGVGKCFFLQEVSRPHIPLNLLKLPKANHFVLLQRKRVSGAVHKKVASLTQDVLSPRLPTPTLLSWTTPLRQSLAIRLHFFSPNSSLGKENPFALLQFPSTWLELEFSNRPCKWSTASVGCQFELILEALGLSPFRAVRSCLTLSALLLLALVGCQS
ncbi:hypothetical protein MRB53_001900 [Persea americana]|uniref:Uncharacterized protein n=1 Tax=Persea americana TaxID=3435 RepID=A0ACC2MSZ0_PERAE|nr:hypothetical protein MRB53_001900 [Persea americana]